MNKLKSESEENRYKEFYKKLDQLEEQRNNLDEEIKYIDDIQEQTKDTYQDVVSLFEDMAEHCDDSQFLIKLSECEDNFRDYYHEIENKFYERKEELEDARKRSFLDEEEICENWKIAQKNKGL